MKIQFNSTIKSFCLLLLILIALPQDCFSQKAIKGNGKLVTEKIPTRQFWEVELQTYANVTLECGKMPLVELTIDENLLEYIDINVEDGKLLLRTEEWLKNYNISLKIQVPFLTRFKTAGWGNINISNLKTESFTLIGKTGNINLSGEVEQIEIISGTGNISAIDLLAKRVIINKSGWGNISVHATDSLIVDGDVGAITYAGDPVIVRNSVEEGIDLKPYGEEYEQNKPVYITVRVKNNSGKKKDFYIRGPREARFSYGFPMRAGTTREEHVPVGTKIWEQNVIGRKLLIEISREDEEKTIDLFN